MSLSNAELIQIFEDTGVGKLPLTGGPSGTLKSTISQTMPLEASVSACQPATGVMDLTAIYLTTGQTITNINFVTGSTAAGTPTHTWFALYDDGRGSATSGQLALLGQTADQGSGAVAANTNLGLSLITPWTTQYTGIYYVAFMNSGTTVPTLSGVIRASSASIALAAAAGALYSGTAGSSLTATAPSPSGAVTVSTRTEYAYVS